MGISSYGLSSQYLQKNETTQMNTEKALASGSLDLVHTVNYTLAEKRSQRLTDSRTWFSVTYTLTTQKTMDHKKKTNFLFSMGAPHPSHGSLGSHPDSFLQKLPVTWWATNALSQHLDLVRKEWSCSHGAPGFSHGGYPQRSSKSFLTIWKYWNPWFQETPISCGLRICVCWCHVGSM